MKCISTEDVSQNIELDNEAQKIEREILGLQRRKKFQVDKIKKYFHSIPSDVHLYLLSQVYLLLRRSKLCILRLRLYLGL